MEDQSKVYYQLRFYDENGMVFHQDEFGDCMYEVQKGSVGVFKNYHHHNEKLLATLGPGEFFGEMAIIEASPRNATIIALENGTILKLISAENFQQYALENPDKASKMVLNMGKKANLMQNNYMDACEVITEFLECHNKRKPKSQELLKNAEKHAAWYKEATSIE